MNHPSFRPTRRSFWLVVHAGQCRPKIVQIGRFYSHRSTPGTYRISWTILQSSLKAAHHNNPQRSRALTQETIKAHSYPCISFSRCWRCSDLKLYCRQMVLISCLHTLGALEHSCALKLFNICFVRHDAAVNFDTPHSSPQRLRPSMSEMFSLAFPTGTRQGTHQTCGAVTH